jgi:large repetitive protein
MLRHGILSSTYKKPVAGGGGSSTLLNGLISYWNCNESAGDGTLHDSINGHNSVSLDASQGTVCKIGAGLTFDGTGGISMGYVADLSPITAITISAWVYNTAAYGSIISNWEYSPDYYGYNLWINMWCPYFAIDGSAAGGSIQGATDIGDAWHLVTGTYDGSYLRLYVDAVEDADAVSYIDTIAYEASCPFLIGTSAAGSGQSDFVTYLDEISIWNRALTQAEVTELWNSGTGKTYPFS